MDARPLPFNAVCHIGGGLHHAFANHGEGFCPLNDVAVAARDPRVFTFSMRQQLNYPVFKPRGALDIGLPDGVHDRTFLTELDGALPRVLASRPECVFYLAGADPYEDDQLGGLRLTREGLRLRDRAVIAAAGAGTAGRRAGGRLRTPPRRHRGDPRGDDRGSGTRTSG